MWIDRYRPPISFTPQHLGADGDAVVDGNGAAHPPADSVVHVLHVAPSPPLPRLPARLVPNPPRLRRPNPPASLVSIPIPSNPWSNASPRDQKKTVSGTVLYPVNFRKTCNILR